MTREQTILKTLAASNGIALRLVCDGEADMAAARTLERKGLIREMSPREIGGEEAWHVTDAGWKYLSRVLLELVADLQAREWALLAAVADTGAAP